MVVFSEKKSQISLRFGVYISGKDIVIHRNKEVRQYSKIGFENQNEKLLGILREDVRWVV